MARAEAAERLRGIIRTWARLGGDEFALVRTALGGVEDAELVVRRVLGPRAAVRARGAARARDREPGVTLFPDDGDTPERLIGNADMALYHAKAAGRRASAFYRPEMDRELQAGRSLQAGLRCALEDGSLHLVYQPVFDVRDPQRVVEVEALVRWRQPSGGQVPPAMFIPVAESSGPIQPLGEWVLRQACREAAAWRAAGIKMAVNVSAAMAQHYPARSGT